jgi:tetratricopeptide (TPR) repeat protein
MPTPAIVRSPRRKKIWIASTYALTWLLSGGAATAQAAAPAEASGSGAAKPALSNGQQAAAEEYFHHGQELFKQGKYGPAWVEFSTAYQLTDLPDLLFNLALAEEKLNRPADAAKHYREFLARSPNDPQTPQIQAKIAQLEHPGEVAPPPPPPPPAPVSSPPRRFPLYSVIAGSGTLLFAIIGGAALGAARSRYDGLASTCAPSCAVADVQGLQPVIQTGQAFLALTAIGAAGTAGLLIWELRRGRGERKTALRFGVGPSMIYGSY